MSDWSDGAIRLMHGDCLERLRELEDASVDALVTDPPAGISFMSRDWDTFPTRQRPLGHTFADGRSRPGIANGQEHNPRAKDVFIGWLAEVMAECLRVLKPGAHGLVWAIPRTSHWTATALEDAGFEIRPEGFVTHHFGQGFPKHRTHLKPATEVWWLVRKPGRSEALFIDACRLAGAGAEAGRIRHGGGTNAQDEWTKANQATMGGPMPSGRWPANLVLSHAEGCRPVGTRAVRSDGHYANGRGQDGAITTGLCGADASEDRYVGLETVEAWECAGGCPVAELDRQSGTLSSGANPTRRGSDKFGLAYGEFKGERDCVPARGADAGGASRFFYVAKADTAERNAGLPPHLRNRHPTVKPVDLMRYLCRLVTPPGGLILDPFAGSGTTLVAAKLEGFGAIGIEQDAEWLEVAQYRVAWAAHQPSLLEPEPVVVSRPPIPAPAREQIGLFDLESAP